MSRRQRPRPHLLRDDVREFLTALVPFLGLCALAIFVLSR